MLLCIKWFDSEKEGKITRQRNTESGMEKSVIDVVIVSYDIIEHIEEINVEDQCSHKKYQNE